MKKNSLRLKIPTHEEVLEMDSHERFCEMCKVSEHKQSISYITGLCDKCWYKTFKTNKLIKDALSKIRSKNIVSPFGVQSSECDKILRIINCPLCGKLLDGKFTPRNSKYHGSGSMARWYWYCKDCKLSVNKSVRKGGL